MKQITFKIKTDLNNREHLFVHVQLGHQAKC